MSGTTTPKSVEIGPSANDFVNAWRAVRYGGVDDSTRDLAVTPAVAAFVPTFVTSIRWGTVLFGMVYAAPQAAHGHLGVVGSLAVMLFLTSWRSSRPLKLASPDVVDRSVGITDALVAGAAIGLSGGLAGPLGAAAMALPLFAAFGWGLVTGLGATVALVGGVAATEPLSSHPHGLLHAPSTWLAAVTLVLALVAVLLRHLSLAAEVRRAELSGQVEALTEANDLLSVLARVARTLPNAYNLQDALDRVRLQLTETFTPGHILLVSPAGDHGMWRTEISDGADAPPLVSGADLPPELQAVLDRPDAVLAGQTLATALRARGEVVGLLMVTADPTQPYADRHRRLLSGLADVLALTIDNGRLFGRLRSFGAEAERNRIARELHDRLGQWLTYISLELERILHHDGTRSEDLDRLHHDVQSAMSELRETLRDLRTTISPERGFEVVAVEVLDRFHERTGVTTEIDITTPGGRLDVEIEHELLRILQEALHNIDKHADASVVDVTWSVSEAGSRLIVHDDGRGFDSSAAAPGSYGLVGMRERATGIGATLQIESTPGAGTRLVVETTMERGT